jgi:hypothetical protein
MIFSKVKRFLMIFLYLSILKIRSKLIYLKVSPISFENKCKLFIVMYRDHILFRAK